MGLRVGLSMKNCWLCCQTHRYGLLMLCETWAASYKSQLAAPSICHNKCWRPAFAFHKCPSAHSPCGIPGCHSGSHAARWCCSASWHVLGAKLLFFFPYLVHQRSITSNIAQSSGCLLIQVWTAPVSLVPCQPLMLCCLKFSSGCTARGTEMTM